MANSVTGKHVSSGACVEIRFDAAVTGIDDLLAPGECNDYVAPGFIDLQVNGFAGVDYNDPETTHEAFAASVETMYQTGITRLLPTVITGSKERILRCLAKIVAAKEELERNGMAEGGSIEAIHVEGPHISPDDGPRGAHPLEHVRPPDVEEFKRWQEAAKGYVRLVTISPEWEGTSEYISAITRTGVVASIGHTKANSDQIRAAVEAGATMSTHLGNGAHAVLPKSRNYIWDQLAEDRLTASFIVDGIHIPETFLRVAVRAKGAEHCVLVTDAVMPAMCSPGSYRLGQVEVQLRSDGSVVLQGGSRLAGSALRMDHAIANTVALGKVSLRDAIAMATINAARVGRIAGRQRALAPGNKADLVRFRWDDPADSSAKTLTVLETIVAGKVVYSA